MSDFWVFGYGSLIWRPGFQYLRSRSAILYGAHRALCIYSYYHRGTPEHPGLVLGLDRGGACRGIAFLVSAQNRQKVIAYLREREQVTSVYREEWRKIRLLSADGRNTKPAARDQQLTDALCYTADRAHPQYAGLLSSAEQVALVQHSVGQSGSNVDYVINTARHLRELDIPDARLELVSRALQAT